MSFNSLASAFGSQLLWSHSIQLVQRIQGGQGVQDVDAGASGHANVYSKVMSTLERCGQWQREQELFQDWVTRHTNVKLFVVTDLRTSKMFTCRSPTSQWWKCRGRDFEM